MLKNKFVPILVVCVVIFAIGLIPLRILQMGFIPKDDALRHAAKAISGKDWSQILVLRPDMKMDSHPGWHAILSMVHKIPGFEAYQLVLFSVFFLFLLFSLAPALLLKRPEAWALSLMTIGLVDYARFGRLLLGRPYIVTMAVIVAIGCLWENLLDEKKRKGTFILLMVLTALATWIHGGWYLFILPVAAFFVARQARAGILAGLAISAGIILGSGVTGHPIMFLTQAVRHVFLAFTNYKAPRIVVSEFQPFDGDVLIVGSVILLLMARAIRGDWERKAIDNPVAILAIMSWALGFLMKRVWLDIGIAATFLWIAKEYQDFLVKRVNFSSWNRFFAACVISGLMLISTTSDTDNRWSAYRPFCYVSFDTPEKAAWAPGNGGIVYNSHMEIFYGMFYKNPNAPWRYMVGFEPGVMPPEDLDVYRNIQINFESASFEPWVKRLRPEDRIITFNVLGKAPDIKKLEWFDMGNRVWIGRLPKKEKR